MFSRMRSLGLAAVVSALVATPALAGPPWISIELPANPYDQATRGAFLLVHAFHHGEPIGYLVTGTAEGIVGGERRSIKLEFSETSRDGVYFYLAESLIKVRRPAEALPYFEKLVAEFDQSEHLQDARKRITELKAQMEAKNPS